MMASRIRLLPISSIKRAASNRCRINHSNVLQVKPHKDPVLYGGFTSTAKNFLPEKTNGEQIDITGNPFFEKYKKKIHHMQK